MAKGQNPIKIKQPPLSCKCEGVNAWLSPSPPLSPWLLVLAVENQSHCDFIKLRNMLVRTHMQDLKDVTRETHYENYRAHCIQSMTRMVVKERNRKYAPLHPPLRPPLARRSAQDGRRAGQAHTYLCTFCMQIIHNEH